MHTQPQDKAGKHLKNSHLHSFGEYFPKGISLRLHSWVLQSGLLLSSLQLKGKKKKSSVTIQPYTCPGLVTSRNAIIVLKPGNEQASVLSTGCLEAYSNSAEIQVPKRASKLPHKVGSNSHIHDYLLIIDSRCYEKRQHKNAFSPGIPRKKKSGLQQKLQIHHFPPLPASAGIRASHTCPCAPGGMSAKLLPTPHQLSASAEGPSVLQPPQGPCRI